MKHPDPIHDAITIISARFMAQMMVLKVTTEKHIFQRVAQHMRADLNAVSEYPDIVQLEAARWPWSQRVFTEATATSSLLKLDEEVKEIRADLAAGTPKAEEYADAIMCLMDSAARAGIGADELMVAYAEKVRVNIARKWEKNADNTYSHIKFPAPDKPEENPWCVVCKGSGRGTSENGLGVVYGGCMGCGGTGLKRTPNVKP